ncbi:MAG: GNAT family N-acetyltransferase [Bacteroidota bacterium]|jgi:ribosomal protein S18 acetylase RimI-like enzyme|nr:GNAT family N-acetyltransferase [Bacteroidota bacterium]
MDIQIRNATVEDVALIQQIAYSTWPIAYGNILSKQQINYMLTLMYNQDELLRQITHGYCYLIAEKNGKSLGFAAYNALTVTQFKLQKLYMLPEAQGMGIGKALLQKVMNQAKLQGAELLLLNVNRHNNAIAFYAKMGFQITKEEDNDIGNGFFMNDYVMQVRL